VVTATGSDENLFSCSLCLATIRIQPCDTITTHNSKPTKQHHCGYLQCGIPRIPFNISLLKYLEIFAIFAENAKFNITPRFIISQLKCRLQSASVMCRLGISLARTSSAWLGLIILFSGWGLLLIFFSHARPSGLAEHGKVE
jgi:hypothetical protein